MGARLNWWHIFLGVAPLLLALHEFNRRRLKRIQRAVEKLLQKLDIEHNMLIIDYCERKGIEPENLPTRRKGLLGDDDGGV